MIPVASWKTQSPEKVDFRGSEKRINRIEYEKTPEEVVSMKQYFRLLVIIVISVAWVIPGGCGKKSVKSEFNHPIIGKWNWVESFGGIGGVRLTPESEGYTKTHVYSPDSTFLGFRNDSLMIVAKYSITRKLVWDSYMAEVLQIEGQIEQIIEFRGNDTLGLGDHVIDGFGHLFVRIKGD